MIKRTRMWFPITFHTGKRNAKFCFTLGSYLQHYYYPNRTMVTLQKKVKICGTRNNKRNRRHMNNYNPVTLEVKFANIKKTPLPFWINNQKYVFPKYNDVTKITGRNFCYYSSFISGQCRTQGENTRTNEP